MLCFDSKKVGYVKKTHGIKGEVVVEFDFPLPKSFKLTEWVFLNYEGTLIPFSIEWYQILDENSILLKFNYFDKVEVVKRFVLSEFYVDNNYKWLSKIESTFLNLNDYKLFDPENVFIGTIKEIFPIKDNPVAEIDNGKESVLIPFHNKFIKAIDHESKTIIIKLPKNS